MPTWICQPELFLECQWPQKKHDFKLQFDAGSISKIQNSHFSQNLLDNCKKNQDHHECAKLVIPFGAAPFSTMIGLQKERKLANSTMDDFLVNMVITLKHKEPQRSSFGRFSVSNMRVALNVVL